MFVRIIIFMLLLDRRRFRPSSVFGTTKSLDSELWLTKVRFRPPAITPTMSVSPERIRNPRVSGQLFGLTPEDIARAGCARRERGLLCARFS